MYAEQITVHTRFWMEKETEARDYQIRLTFVSEEVGADGHIERWPFDAFLNWIEERLSGRNVLCYERGKETDLRLPYAATILNLARFLGETVASDCGAESCAQVDIETIARRGKTCGTWVKKLFVEEK